MGMYGHRDDLDQKQHGKCNIITSDKFYADRRGSKVRCKADFYD